MEELSDISQKLYTYKEEHPDTQWYLGWCLSDTHQFVQTRDELLFVEVDLF